ncbi:MAG: nitrile hydratase subunit alpha [Gammaproteobacteria bacterium]|nr:nitrile hydratase subunit alpha [Gammaproteobacteria bacterium]
MSEHTHEPGDQRHTAVEQVEPHGYYQYLADAVRELLIEKDVFSADDMRRAIEAMDSRTPAQGARVIARALVDPAYKARLLADGSTAVEELGIDMGTTKLVVVESTPTVHNIIVCTLCSCYPRMLLGVPPSWYKSREYRSRVVREPRAVLAEFGTKLSDDVDVRVHDSTADMRYLVLPMRPAGTGEMGEEELAALVTRDTMVGVAQVRMTA